MAKYKVSAVQTTKEEIENVIEADSKEEALEKAKNKEIDFIETAYRTEGFGTSTIEAVGNHKIEGIVKDEDEEVEPMSKVATKLSIDEDEL